MGVPSPCTNDWIKTGRPPSPSRLLSPSAEILPSLLPNDPPISSCSPLPPWKKLLQELELAINQELLRGKAFSHVSSPKKLEHPPPQQLRQRLRASTNARSKAAVERVDSTDLTRLHGKERIFSTITGVGTFFLRQSTASSAS